ncbi:MAG: hypothetical protein H6706_01330 [Myxococcales bacterium]|nr:hypothetical protein [Myxococcales bacterium]
MSAKRYLEAVRAQFGYLGTWLPNTAIRLGDVGFYTPEGFRVETSLRRLGVSVRSRPAGVPGDLSHTSVASVKATVGLKGVPALSLGFGRAGGFVFQATGCKVKQIDDLDTVGIEMVNLCQQNIWQPGWVLVDTIVEADKTTILVSQSDDATVDLSGPTTISALNEASLAVTAQSGSLLQFLGQPGLTPLFRGRRVSRGFLGLFKDKVEVMRGIDDVLPPTEFEEVGALDFEDDR